MFLTAALAGLTGTGAAVGTAAATTAAAAGTGFSFASVLQGVATVSGLVASIAAGNADAAKYNLQAQDAESQKGFEIVQSADRKRSLLAAAQESVGKQDVAYAGSGVDLSFGSAAQSRTNAYREADLGLNTDTATTSLKLSRLDEQATNLRLRAKQASSMGFLNAIPSFLSGSASLARQH